VQGLAQFLAQQSVAEPHAVRASERTDDRGLLVSLNVAPDDMGKVIGKGGRTARAIRSVVRAAGTRQDIHASVEIVED